LVITFLKVLAASISNAVQDYFSVMETEEAGSSDVSNHLQIDIASYAKRTESSRTLL
jgi:hypothetical protein